MSGVQAARVGFRMVVYTVFEVLALAGAGVGIVVFIYSAYAYSRQFPPTEWVHSVGEIVNEMNAAPIFVFAGLPALAVASLLAFILITLTRKGRARAWVVPVATVALTVAIVGLSLLGLRKQ